MNQRGQGTVEFAFAAVLFVGVLMGGLWLAELGFLSLKVQEAGAAAAWNATGRQVHDFSQYNSSAAVRAGYFAALNGPTSADKVTRNRYRDFDAALNSGTGTARLFARGYGMDVSCVQANTAARFDLPTTTSDYGRSVPSAINSKLNSWFQPMGGTACSASADALPYQMPENFLNSGQGSLFKEKLHDGQSLKLCAVGRSVSGTCPGGYALLLGDWGFDAQPNSELVMDGALPNNFGEQNKPRNWPYRSMVRQLFGVSGQRYDADDTSKEGAAERFARKVGGGLGASGRAPNDEKKFYMSYAGSEHDYVDMLIPQALPDTSCLSCHFNTSGTQTAAGNPKPNWQYDWRNLRAPCFLGIGGCRVQ